MLLILSFGKEIKHIVFVFGYNPLPDDKILDWSKLKETADDSLMCI